MDENQLRIQFARLKRHHQLAADNNDPIAFLDLAHCIRIWTEMKAEVDKYILDNNLEIKLTNTQKDNSIKNILKDVPFIHMPLASIPESSGGVSVKGLIFAAGKHSLMRRLNNCMKWVRLIYWKQT